MHERHQPIPLTPFRAFSSFKRGVCKRGQPPSLKSLPPLLGKEVERTGCLRGASAFLEISLLWVNNVGCLRGAKPKI